MKRLSSSESLGPMISICPPAEEKGSSGGSNAVYNRGFQPMLDGLDEEDCAEESGHIAEKKRRLSIDQVKALEKNFEVENKLEPERKVKLAQELGLQPRQVAVWFQNRRARWKTKQLERDYGLLKANYEALKLNYDALHHDKEALLLELRELKSKLQDEKPEINHPIKQEIDTTHSQSLAESEKKMPDGINVSAIGGIEGSEIVTDPNLDQYNGVIFGDLKDGSSDSDSSAILNDDNSPNTAISSEMFPQMILYPSSSSSCGLRYSCSSSPAPPISCMQKAYHQFLRMDESSLSSFLNPEEACDFFSEEQAPTLPWYGSEAWD